MQEETPFLNKDTQQTTVVYILEYLKRGNYSVYRLKGIYHSVFGKQHHYCAMSRFDRVKNNNGGSRDLCFQAGNPGTILRLSQMTKIFRYVLGIEISHILKRSL